MTAKSFTLLRKGSNGANQPSMLGWVDVGKVEAVDRKSALQSEEAAGITLYNNQVLDAVTRFPRGFQKSPDGSYWPKS